MNVRLTSTSVGGQTRTHLRGASEPGRTRRGHASRVWARQHKEATIRQLVAALERSDHSIVGARLIKSSRVWSCHVWLCLVMSKQHKGRNAANDSRGNSGTRFQLIRESVLERRLACRGESTRVTAWLGVSRQVPFLGRRITRQLVARFESSRGMTGIGLVELALEGA